jgi:hypothetical protein
MSTTLSPANALTAEPVGRPVVRSLTYGPSSELSDAEIDVALILALSSPDILTPKLSRYINSCMTARKKLGLREMLGLLFR